MKKYLSGVIGLLAAFTFTSCLKENVNNAVGELNPMASLYVVRAAYKEADVQITKNLLGGAYQATGVVVGSASSGNLPDGMIVIQDEWRGLVRGLALLLNPADAAGLEIGDSILVNLEGGVLSRSEGPLAVKGLGASAITKISGGHSVVPRPVNITDLNTNFLNFENTLVSVTADVTPLPVGETLAGEKSLNDGGDLALVLFTEQSADFADEALAPSASFIGIPMKYENGIQLRMMKYEDMLNPSGPIYAGYPEDFEGVPNTEKGSYAGKDIDLATGNWRLEQCLLGVTTGRDRIVSGKQAIRFQQNLGPDRPSYLQMNYDLTNGATKVTFWYGCYYTDQPSSFVLQASTDQGVTWTQIGDVISDPEPTNVSITAKQATYTMSIEGNVRFRILKLPLGPTSIPTVYNGRLGVDDFAVYQDY